MWHVILTLNQTKAWEYNGRFGIWISACWLNTEGFLTRINHLFSELICFCFGCRWSWGCVPYGAWDYEDAVCLAGTLFSFLSPANIFLQWHWYILFLLGSNKQRYLYLWLHDTRFACLGPSFVSGQSISLKCSLIFIVVGKIAFILSQSRTKVSI